MHKVLPSDDALAPSPLGDVPAGTGQGSQVRSPLGRRLAASVLTATLVAVSGWLACLAASRHLGMIAAHDFEIARVTRGELLKTFQADGDLESAANLDVF